MGHMAQQARLPGWLWQFFCICQVILTEEALFKGCFVQFLDDAFFVAVKTKLQETKAFTMVVPEG
jgi:hypothetical protein